MGHHMSEPADAKNGTASKDRDNTLYRTQHKE